MIRQAGAWPALLLAATTPSAGLSPDPADAPLPASLAGTAAEDPAAAAARSHELFLRLIGEGRDAEAVDAARQRLVYLEAAGESGGDDYASALTNFGTALLRTGENGAAAEAYRAAITTLEAGAGILSPRLVNPLIGLGEALNRDGRYADGAAAYERALKVHQANEGFYNFDQFPIRDGLTESMVGLGRLNDADFHQRTQLRVHARKAGPRNPEIAAAHFKLGRWYRRIGEFDKAEDEYITAIRKIKSAWGSKHPALVPAYDGLAGLYREANAPRESTVALNRALAIVDSQPVVDRELRSRLLLAQADGFITFNKPNTAADRYRLAWQEIAGDGYALARDREFANPRRLPRAGLPLPRLDAVARKRGLSPVLHKGLLGDGYALVRYSVDTAGRAQNIEILESEPPGRIDSRLIRALKLAYFRPRVKDGEPVYTTGLMLRHEFKYALDEEPPADNDGVPQGPGEALPPPGTAESPGG